MNMCQTLKKLSNNIDARKEKNRKKTEQKTSTSKKEKRSFEWKDSEETSLMYDLIHDNEVQDLKAWIKSDPDAAFIRSSDGRGPMFWAYEFGRDEITKILMKA